jgi:hypothetical protein
MWEWMGIGAGARIASGDKADSASRTGWFADFGSIHAGFLQRVLS